MPSPKTPTKSDGARSGIIEIVRSLSSQWHLELPDPDARYTPSRNENAWRPEVKVYSRIKYLYYRDRALLHVVVRAFEQWAGGIGFKEEDRANGLKSALAEDTLSRRNLANRSKASAASTADLLAKFLQLLDDAANTVKKRSASTPEHAPSPSAKHGSGGRPGFPEYAALETVKRQLFTPLAHLPSSSTDYGDLTTEDFKSLQPKFDAQHPTDSSDDDGVNEKFSTPPTTPTPLVEETPSQEMASLELDDFTSDLSTDTSFKRTIDKVPILPSPPSKRRAPSDPSSSLRSRKVSKVASDWVPVHAYNALSTPRVPPNQGVPTKIPFEGQAPNTGTSTSVPRPLGQSNGQSFTSDTSADTTASDPFMWESQGKEPTTANTSFRSDANTSFHSDVSMEQSFRAPPAKETDTTVFTALQEDLYSRLCVHTPFSKENSVGLEAADLRTRYEVTRVALEFALLPRELLARSGLKSLDSTSLWSSSLEHARLVGKKLPPRSPARVWEQAGDNFENVSMGGELIFNERSKDPPFRLALKPLKLAGSYRLSRRFGSDRFICLTMPALTKSQMPEHLRSDADAARDVIVNWLCYSDHHLLGRTWKAFGEKPATLRKKDELSSKNSTTVPGHHIFLFAVSGCDMKSHTRKLPPKGEGPTEHSELSIQELWDWVMPRCCNEEMEYTKAFRRLDLVLSSTRPSIIFKPVEILRCDDITTETSLPRSLDPEKSNKIKTNGRRNVPGPLGKVMNDGCGRISRDAACAIAESLDLRHVPSAFQGRIAGAKGIWIVDYTSQKLASSSRNYWLEVTDSQWKFNVHMKVSSLPHETDEDLDEDHLTFEVIRWSKPLAPASLNMQIISVLTQCQLEVGQAFNSGDAARRISRMNTALKDLFEEDLVGRVGEIKEAMHDPIALRKLNQGLQRLSLGPATGTLEEGRTIGPLPNARSKQMVWFLDQGFRPETNAFLNDLSRRFITQQREQLHDRMNIRVGRSTRCFMVPDPAGVLDEREIQLCFYKPFKDSNSLFETDMLHDIDVLVSRNPAHCPWDIQKVRAVFKPELRQYKDVIVFSTKGSTPLASVLSGGDYDGDEAWVCWEPRIVHNFQNVAPTAPKGPEYFGITRETHKLHDLSLSDFLTRSFKFNMQPNLLGVCTKYFDKLVYHQRSIAKPAPILVGTLLGHLVDQSKQGYNFPNEAWESFLAKLRKAGQLGQEKLSEPAYLENGRLKPTEHILDQLILVTGTRVIEREFTALYNDTRIEVKKDPDLLRMWRQVLETHENVDGSKEVMEVLRTVIVENRKIFGEGPPRDDKETEGEYSFNHRMEEMHARFNRIMPPASDHPVVQNWREGVARRGDFSDWALIKASEAYRSWGHTKVVWWVVGKQLGQLKAEAMGYQPVIPMIYHGLKIRSEYVRQVREGRLLDIDRSDEDVMCDD
ncbi:MAG: hypothetical protein M1837_004851 [Sclerophora amabilis]|nr:MAG: hypothetical protein M1837_004851 [Sclerophora amabilis]